MNKCRICLKTRTKLFSIFDIDNRQISFLDMINSIANVQFQNNMEINEICRLCRKKLIDAYDFKCLIERSHIALSQSTNTNLLKRINFSDIKEVKLEFEPFGTDSKGNIVRLESLKTQLSNGEEMISYNDITIKKVEPTKQPISVLEFLNSIKQEDDDNYDMNDYGSMEDNSDEDYKLHVPLNKRKNSNKKNKVPRKQKVCIKPVYLNHLKLVYGLPDKPDNPKVKKRACDYIKVRMCPHCGKMTKSLKYHILIHTGERKFKCEICAKGFYNQATLKIHEKRHSNERNYKCEQCMADFIDKGSLRAHMLIHSDEKKHICRTCNKAFKRSAAKLRHERSHNLGNKSIKCEMCNMSFFDNVTLRHHLRVHTGERPYKCEICSQPYSYKHDFNRHCFNKHGIYLKRRSVYVMNEEVLKQERINMRKLMLLVHGIPTEEPFNPYEGPQAHLFLEKAIKDLSSRKVPIEFQL